MDMRTPLGKVRGLGSAKDGTHHFWVQRMTAVALVPLFLFFIIFLLSHVGSSYEELVGSLSNPVIAVLVGLMVIAGLVHGRIGMQEIINDYVHHDGLKFLCLMGNTFFTVLIGALCLFAVLRIGFAG
ncbi:succinate dehydrogenase, hydrophobic membrane anchor protein [Rhizobium sp. L1K21]|uniref:succinate dehydrogenase, hydrophobic membrane anchor protein n=1 Tax=Rhizobium sp. L1K21 TaxID=2954933 RepID=UPI0020939874|nr:succinate dehydrogenase, hydrophobic membrane anchor protein [Rhizobium sp. L1K21]MCO6184883.1 succinate dehydrogenase, hydrophobic membrane anchor protein [Rhizobium sp. L1K21]